MSYRSKQIYARRREQAQTHFDALIKRHGGLCYWCAEPVVRFNTLSRHWQPRIVKSWIEYRRRGRKHRVRLATVDHLKPIWRGGNSSLSNLVLACGECNHLRNEIDWIRETEWFDYPQRRGFAEHCHNVKNRMRQKLRFPEFTAEATALWEECEAFIALAPSF